MQGQIMTKTIQIKDLPVDQAVDKGSELVGEVFIFSVAVLVAAYEYDRSSKSSKEKELQANEREFQREQALEKRFRDLERQIRAMDDQILSLEAQVEDNTSSLRRYKEEQQAQQRRRRSQWSIGSW
jgi:uncharacterized protein HemX